MMSREKLNDQIELKSIYHCLFFHIKEKVKGRTKQNETKQNETGRNLQNNNNDMVIN